MEAYHSSGDYYRQNLETYARLTEEIRRLVNPCENGDYRLDVTYNGGQRFHEPSSPFVGNSFLKDCVEFDPKTYADEANRYPATAPLKSIYASMGRAQTSMAEFIQSQRQSQYGRSIDDASDITLLIAAPQLATFSRARYPRPDEDYQLTIVHLSQEQSPERAYYTADWYSVDVQDHDHQRSFFNVLYANDVLVRAEHRVFERDDDDDWYEVSYRDGLRPGSLLDVYDAQRIVTDLQQL